MPKNPINYQNSIIYKIVCKDISVTDIYVGSTRNLTKRKYLHKYDCSTEKRKQYNFNVYKFIRANGGFENFDLIQIEQYNAKDKNDLHSRERYWLEQLKATLNKQVPTRTLKEHYQDNKAEINKRHKQYCEENKDKIDQYFNQYREKHKDKLNEKNKQYYEHNKEKIKERQEKYYEKNKDALNAKAKQNREKKKHV